jgi:hypothetical protein
MKAEAGEGAGGGRGGVGGAPAGAAQGGPDDEIAVAVNEVREGGV